MLSKTKTALASSMTMAFLLSSGTFAYGAEKKPSVLTSTVTEDPATSMALSWETRNDVVEKAVAQVVKKTDKSGFNSGEVLTFTSDDLSDIGGRTYSKVVAEGLDRGTEYVYRVGDGTTEGWSEEGHFKTATESKEPFTFLYLSDTQIGNPKTDGKLTEKMMKHAASQFKERADFTYLAGDFTDTATNRDQWDSLFDGSNNVYQDSFLVPVLGNHDRSSGRYIDQFFPSPATGTANTEAEIPYVYSFDYGSAQFLSLNTEDVSNGQLQQQIDWMKEEVASSDQPWQIVLFHKSIYSGASHVTDANIIDIRKQLSPALDEAGVDLVLAGHDHVYTRGFVNGDGSRAEAEQIGENPATVRAPDAPLHYMLASGGLKFYNEKEYKVGDGDPLLPNYEYLDVKNTNKEDAASDDGNKMTFSGITVTEDAITFDSYYTTTKTLKNEHLETYTIKKETEEADDAWSADTIYTAGDQVTHKGHLYEAKWWTKGEDPSQSGEWDVWKKLDRTEEEQAGYRVWNRGDVYTAGEQVAHEGAVYEAKWWTKGENPSKSGDWDVWKKVKDL